MPETKVFSVLPEERGKRLDQYLSEQLPDKTRSSIQKLISQQAVACQNKVLPKNYRLRGDEELKVEFPDPVELDVRAENLPLDIVYEDADLLVVNKPKGMVVHPAAGNHTGTLVNALLYHCKDSLSGINGVIRPGIVHRIDKDTSGLLIVAKNDFAHVKLAEQIKEHSFDRTYQAVVYGKLNPSEGIVNGPIGRSERDRKKMCVTEKNSKPAVTHYRTLCEYQNFSHLELKLETGRTHQIRVHMASLGHPVAGDPVYGPKKCISSLNGQCLHAKSIGFIHPSTGEYLFFDSELPPYFQKFLRQLKNQQL